MPKVKAAKAKKTKARKKEKPVSSEQSIPVKTIMVVEKPAIQNSKHGKLKHSPVPEKWFILSSGKEIRTLKELAQDLGDMEDFVFEHHVNEHRNDFVSWIKDVFEDAELAEKIAHYKDKKRMQMIVYEHIVDKLW